MHPPPSQTCPASRPYTAYLPVCQYLTIRRSLFSAYIALATSYLEKPVQFFSRPNLNRVDLLSYGSWPTEIRWQYDWITETNGREGRYFPIMLLPKEGKGKIHYCFFSRSRSPNMYVIYSIKQLKPAARGEGKCCCHYDEYSEKQGQNLSWGQTLSLLFFVRRPGTFALATFKISKGRFFFTQ